MSGLGGRRKKSEARARGWRAFAILTCFRAGATMEDRRPENCLFDISPSDQSSMRADWVLAEAPIAPAYLLRCGFSTEIDCFLYSGRSVAR
jgi:hypothetical protein